MKIIYHEVKTGKDLEQTILLKVKVGSSFRWGALGLKYQRQLLAQCPLKPVEKLNAFVDMTFLNESKAGPRRTVYGN